jgi:hypothetical protein
MVVGAAHRAVMRGALGKRVVGTGLSLVLVDDRAVGSWVAESYVRHSHK